MVSAPAASAASSSSPAFDAAQIYANVIAQNDLLAMPIAAISTLAQLIDQVCLQTVITVANLSLRIYASRKAKR